MIWSTWSSGKGIGGRNDAIRRVGPEELNNERVVVESQIEIMNEDDAKAATFHQFSLIIFLVVLTLDCCLNPSLSPYGAFGLGKIHSHSHSCHFVKAHRISS